ncbi:MAG: ComF family protein [Ardenticatenaceae bacterium]|nr:ComF family protein [Ardenticatenaceae bacterium]
MALDSASSKIKLVALIETLRDLVFPPVCANCRKVGKQICSECHQQIQWVKKPICSCCGRLVVSDQIVICDACMKRPPPLKQIRAATIFAEPISTIIHKMKYQGAFGLSRVLAELMVSAWNEWKIPVDMVAPIPLHPDREKKRGYNQSALLGRWFSQQSRLVYVPDLLKRTRFTIPQVGLSAEERAKNVQGAFAVDGYQLIGKHVLLVDDVCTTGSTLAAAAQVVLETGAAAVSGYCLARAM